MTKAQMEELFGNLSKEGTVKLLKEGFTRLGDDDTVELIRVVSGTKDIDGDVINALENNPFTPSDEATSEDETEEDDNEVDA